MLLEVLFIEWLGIIYVSRDWNLGVEWKVIIECLCIGICERGCLKDFWYEYYGKFFSNFLIWLLLIFNCVLIRKFKWLWSCIYL